MAMKLYSDSDISDIADAIRSKNGTSDTYKVSQMASAIQAIPTGGITPTGTKQITANGTGIDVYSYQYADVAVPNSYSASDEGKVVSNGALVAQTSDTVTANDTYDTTLINSLTVNVSGGGGVSVNDIAQRTIGKDITITVPIKAYAFYGTDVETIVIDGITDDVENYSFAQCKSLKTVNVINTNGFNFKGFNFQGCSALETFNAPYNTSIGERCFDGCSKLGPYLVHNCIGLWTNTLNGCSSLVGIDLGTDFNNTRATMCNGCTLLTSFVIRRTENVVSLANISAFNNTPFASGKAGGTLYVPSALISSYQSATNWSTILGYANNQIKSIESTHTDPTAPVDLTTHFIDGTLIPTS